MDFLIHHMIRSSAVAFPQKEALVCGETRLSYSQIYGKINSLAAAFKQAGLQRGDRLGIYLEPCTEQALSIFAASAADATFVPINHQLLPEQVLHIMKDCSMTGLITTSERWESLSQQASALESTKFAFIAGRAVSTENKLAIVDLDEALEQNKSGLPNGCIGNDLAAILYTSGSTGKPKGVMLTHAQIMAGASIVSDYLEITNTERILAVLPFSFDAGMNQIMSAFQQGATVIMMTFVFAKQIIAMLQKEQITGLAGVPTLWNLMAQAHLTLEKTPLPHLRYITNTGGAMPQPVLATLRKCLPQTRVFLMYGLTEAFRSTFLPPEELDRRPTSIGKAIPNTEIMVINDRGEPCKPGEAGELVHRGPTVSLGYWGHPELTNKVLRPHPYCLPELQDGERVCYSGDLVKMDEEGFFYFLGRRDAMIKSSGFRISPTEVEDAIFRSGKVAGVAVIGIPDEVLGQHIKAFVVPANGAEVDVDDLINYCTERLPRYMIPKFIEVIRELPKTSSGKIDYPALRKLEGL